MKIACQDNMVPGDSFEEKLDNLEAYGYDGIELWGTPFIDDPSHVKTINKACEKSKVKPSTVLGGYRGCLLDAKPEARQLAIDDLKLLLKVAADIGAVGMICVPVFRPQQLPDLSPYMQALELEKELCVCICDELGKVASQSGSVLLLEPLNRYESHFLRTLTDAAQICERVGNPNVAIMADFFHMHIEERNTPQSIRDHAKWIRHVHLADSTRELPGYGDIDFRAGFAALRETGYEGYMALECGLPDEKEGELAKCADYLKGCMT